MTSNNKKMMIVGGSLLAIIGGVMGYGYLKAKRENTQRQIQQQEQSIRTGNSSSNRIQYILDVASDAASSIMNLINPKSE